MSIYGSAFALASESAQQAIIDILRAAWKMSIALGARQPLRDLTVGDNADHASECFDDYYTAASPVRGPSLDTLAGRGSLARTPVSWDVVQNAWRNTTPDARDAVAALRRAYSDAADVSFIGRTLNSGVLRQWLMQRAGDAPRANAVQPQQPQPTPATNTRPSTGLNAGQVAITLLGLWIMSRKKGRR